MSELEGGREEGLGEGGRKEREREREGGRIGGGEIGVFQDPHIQNGLVTSHINLRSKISEID